MAYKKVESGTEEWNLFRDILRFKEQFNVPEDTEVYWQKLHDAGVELNLKYARTPVTDFAKEMIFAVINELNRRSKKV